MNADILDRLLGHNIWATRLLIERCRSLTPDQYMQKFEIGPGNLHATLTHCVASMLHYADQLSGRPRRDSRDLAREATTPDQLLPHLEAAERSLRRAARKMQQDGRLDEIMKITDAVGRSWRFSRGTCIVHVLTHGVHHRAQVLNMLRQLGVPDVPDVDAVDWELTGADKVATSLRKQHSAPDTVTVPRRRGARKSAKRTATGIARQRGGEAKLRRGVKKGRVRRART